MSADGNDEEPNFEEDDMEDMKRRVQEMEEEAQKLQELQESVAKEVIYIIIN